MHLPPSLLPHLSFPDRPLICLWIFFQLAPVPSTDNLLPSLLPQGDSRYAETNFTDLLAPYRGIDSWGEIRTELWLEKRKVFAPYLSVIGSHVHLRSDSGNQALFPWQNYFQTAIGLQVYPARILGPGKVPAILHGLRLYGWTGKRYYRRDPDQAFMDRDHRVGVDYYFDNLFDRQAMINGILWTDASWRYSNFAHEAYNVFFSSGNLKLGHALRGRSRGQRRLFAYGFLDWAYAAGCACRWWENAVKPGIGISAYPIKNLFVDGSARSTKSQPPRGSRDVNRISFYVEWIPAVWWLGDQPPAEVARYDFRAGISFSTSELLGGR